MVLHDGQQVGNFDKSEERADPQKGNNGLLRAWFCLEYLDQLIGEPFFERLKLPRTQSLRRFIIALSVMGIRRSGQPIREGIDVGAERVDQEWPLTRTRHTPFYLDAATKCLTTEPVTEASSIAYDATAGEALATFAHTFNEDTELTGYYKLKLWVEAKGADDMDLFAAVQKLDLSGELVNFYYITRFRFGHAAHGWLRVSHRELDAAKSTPWQPYHPHTNEQRLAPGEIAPVEIEIWPSSTLFRAGEQMRVIVMGKDPFPPQNDPGVVIAIHPETRNAGQHIIHTGGQYDSHILVPVIPAKN